MFDVIPQKSMNTWTSPQVGTIPGGPKDQNFDFFFRMQSEGIRPNPSFFAAILASAASHGELQKGRSAHAQLIKLGFESTLFVCHSLMSMYSKCRLIKEAKSVFECFEHRDSVSWNSMMSALASSHSHREALRFFFRMRAAGAKPTQSSFATAISISSNLKSRVLARQLHGTVVKEGYVFDGNTMTSLLVAYTKCAEMEEAFQLFTSAAETHNVVSFTALIGGYIQIGETLKPLVLYSEMRRCGIEPNDFTYSTLLTASPSIHPSLVHSALVKTSYECFASVGTALLDAYAKNGNTHDSFLAFKRIDEKDIVAWSAMMSSLAQAGDAEGSIGLFMEMAREGVMPNEFTLSSIINACSSATAAVDQGRQFHASLIKLRLQDSVCVSSSLVTMYAKKGSIENAYRVFERQSARDSVSWNAMISGFAQHGYGKRALEIFRDMEANGLEMDAATFVGVIMACTHTRLVEEGRGYFNSMVEDHGIPPTMEVYACMVDLYGRAGELEEALKLIKGMPFDADAMVWRILLGACRVHRNVELGEIAAKNLMELEPRDSAAYVLMSNIYAASGKWEERGRVRKMMDDRKVKKEAGRSWIQIKSKIHSFVASDTCHPLSDEIYRRLKEMALRLKEKGYVPDTSFVLYEVELEQKEALLEQHSERLAVALGLISTPAGSPLQIVKNLRVCGDCHAVFKLVSEMEGRNLVVRDSSRFHHFVGGSCSCGDFW